MKVSSTTKRVGGGGGDRKDEVFFSLEDQGTANQRVLHSTQAVVVVAVVVKSYPTNIASVKLAMGCSKVFFFTIPTPALAY